MVSHQLRISIGEGYDGKLRHDLRKYCSIFGFEANIGFWKGKFQNPLSVYKIRDIYLNSEQCQTHQSI